ncbi:hypothetical protein PLANPX_2843 [Lacipirellula parvula]|uniref:PEP-CTERM protein-sorting domain-containing protein n=1 Tax=Lacipirellula parvula TaxID=2650471 RepID=A0A5K7XED3_9BACT|nr:hypothetical protein PLANPX_2843 [Lacipirellula parvula]
MKSTLVEALLVLLISACGRLNAATYQVSLLNQSPQQAAAGGLYGDATVGGLGNPGNAAALWPTPSSPPVSLHPAGFAASSASKIHGNSQVGQGTIAGGETHALLWHSTPESVIDLHPEGYRQSTATDVSESTQVGAGIATGGSAYHALLWSGTSASVVDLHAPSYSQTYAWAADETGQTGWGLVGSPSTYHALVWHGTAESVVDLHPDSYRLTTAYGGGGTSQVGYGMTKSEPVQAHALLWHGSASSVVNLHPPGFTYTSAQAAAGEWQVGNGALANSNVTRALAWKGSADSVIDLHSILEQQTGLTFYSSVSTDVDECGNVVGIGEVRGQGRFAIRWSLVPEPTSFVIATLGLLIAYALTQRRASGYVLLEQKERPARFARFAGRVNC